MEFPRIEIPEAKAYWSAYEYGEALDKLFPEQEAMDFAYAVENNGSPADLSLGKIQTFILTQEGERDGADWIWLVSEQKSPITSHGGVTYIAHGGCDYTGWDCQSYLAWVPLFTK